MDRSGQTVIAHTATYDDVDGGLQSPQWMPMPMTHDKKTLLKSFSAITQQPNV